MGDRLQTLALGAANLTAVLCAFAVVCFLAWLCIATIRHRLSRAAKRRQRTEHLTDDNPLRLINLATTDLDAELRKLTKEIGQ